MTDRKEPIRLTYDVCLFPELFAGKGADLLPLSAAKGAASSAKMPGLRHKAGHDPRAAALLALSRVLWEGVDGQAAVSDALGKAPGSGSGLVPSDRALCTELVYGTLRNFIRLQWIAANFLSRPEKLPFEMRLALVLALYESLHLRTPQHASVNWAVSHVRNRFGKGLGGVANGALRGMLRAKGDIGTAAIAANVAADHDALLGLQYAMPRWIVRQLLDQYGKEAAEAVLAASCANPPAGLRLNMARPKWQDLRDELINSALGKKRNRKPGDPDAAEAGSAPEDGAWMGEVMRVGESALAFQGALPPQSRDPLKQGRASRQSAASYAALENLAPSAWPQPVWDCCAGRGGKTLALLERGVSVALASDASRQRLSALPEEYARLGLTSPPCPALRLLGAEDAPSFPGTQLAETDIPEGDVPEQFGTVLVDAPCSGLGTLARHPEIRLRRTPEDVDRLVQSQSAILDSVWQRVAQGGLVAYITCTCNKAENEDQVRVFLGRHTDAVLEKEIPVVADVPLREFFYRALIRKSR